MRALDFLFSNSHLFAGYKRESDMIVMSYYYCFRNIHWSPDFPELDYELKVLREEFRVELLERNPDMEPSSLDVLVEANVFNVLTEDERIKYLEYVAYNFYQEVRSAKREKILVELYEMLETYTDYFDFEIE